LIEHLAAINRHPRMEELYLKDMRGWAEAGGGLFVAFSFVYPPRRWGAWGVLEYQNQPEADAPKLRAIRSMMQAWHGRRGSSWGGSGEAGESRE
jgi:hypothetical protein